MLQGAVPKCTTAGELISLWDIVTPPLIKPAPLESVNFVAPLESVNYVASLTSVAFVAPLALP